MADMKAYNEASTKMEEMGVNFDYLVGWQGGYLDHPEREEQNVNDAYSAGFEDGKAQTTDNFGNWVK